MGGVGVQKGSGCTSVDVPKRRQVVPVCIPVLHLVQGYIGGLHLPADAGSGGVDAAAEVDGVVTPRRRLQVKLGSRARVFDRLDVLIVDVQRQALLRVPRILNLREQKDLSVSSFRRNSRQQNTCL